MFLSSMKLLLHTRPDSTRTRFIGRLKSNQAAVSVDIVNLTVSIVSLENAIQAALHVSPQVILKVRAKAAKIRAAAESAHQHLRYSYRTAKSRLQLQRLCQAREPYSGLAAIVINATQQALAARKFRIRASYRPIHDSANSAHSVILAALTLERSRGRDEQLSFGCENSQLSFDLSRSYPAWPGPRAQLRSSPGALAWRPYRDRARRS